jgi:hypothetical protein
MIIFPKDFEFRRKTTLPSPPGKPTKYSNNLEMSLGFVISSRNERINSKEYEDFSSSSLTYIATIVHILADGKVRKLPVDLGVIPMCEILFDKSNLV